MGGILRDSLITDECRNPHLRLRYRPLQEKREIGHPGGGGAGRDPSAAEVLRLREAPLPLRMTGWTEREQGPASHLQRNPVYISALQIFLPPGTRGALNYASGDL